MKEALWIVATVALVAINGFFVAAEFALVKVRAARLNEMASGGRPLAKTALWLHQRMNRALSACQLGITMASLGLGWVGEPAIARLLEPLFAKVGLDGPALHTVSFIIAFTAITAAHLVLGEQAPKIFALRHAEDMTLRCAPLLKWFYLASFPLNVALDRSTAMLLRLFGVRGAGHEESASEQEIRAMLSIAHAQGDLTRSEHRMLEAVFDFDDRLCRQIMVPRADVAYLSSELGYDEVMREIGRSRHTRYPVCDGSLDNTLGVVHARDLLGPHDEGFDLKAIMRPPHRVPETSPISRLLRHFQASRQHLALVIDEHGSVSGIVTLENVLEQIVGPVQDEFDDEMPKIVPDGADRYIVAGGTLLATVNHVVGVDLASDQVDTLGGLLMQNLERVPRAGDRVELEGCTAEVLEVRQSRASRIRLILGAPGEEANGGA